MKRLIPTLVPILLLVVGLLTGYFVRDGQNKPTPADVQFLQGMVMHHNQAIDMASRLHGRLIKTEQEASPLQHLTYDIQMGQASQVGTMLGWLQMWNENPGMSMDMTHLGMRTPQEVQSLSTLPEKEAKVKFLQYMVTHHQGGVIMAEDALERAKTREVRKLAAKIVQAQGSEIETMTGMLSDLGARTLPAVQKEGREHPHP